MADESMPAVVWVREQESPCDVCGHIREFLIVFLLEPVGSVRCCPWCMARMIHECTGFELWRQLRQWSITRDVHRQIKRTPDDVVRGT